MVGRIIAKPFRQIVPRFAELRIKAHRPSSQPTRGFSAWPRHSNSWGRESSGLQVLHAQQSPDASRGVLLHRRPHMRVDTERDLAALVTQPFLDDLHRHTRLEK